MSRQGAAASSASVTAAVDEVVALVSDTDLLTTPLALHFCLTVLPQQPQNAEQIAAKFLPAALRLVKSPLLQVRIYEPVVPKQDVYLSCKQATSIRFLVSHASYFRADRALHLRSCWHFFPLSWSRKEQTRHLTACWHHSWQPALQLRRGKQRSTAWPNALQG